MRRRTRSGIGVERLESRRLLSQVVYVDVNSPAAAPARDGLSWGTAFDDVQAALAAAVAGDEIRVADGTYKPTSGTDRNATFQLKSGVSVLGGFGGYGAADPDARDATLNKTFLSGDIGAAGTYTDNSIHVVTASDVDAAALLDGFIVTAGNAAVNGVGNGGGIYNGAGSLTISNCTFTANRAGTRGGAIYNAGAAAPAILDCTFSGNYAAQGGGGIANAAGATPLITDSTFARNYSYDGAGIHNAYDNGSAVITGCTFTENWCQSGGGIYANGGTTTVTDCTFVRNVSSYQGGGMISYGSSVANISYCTFYGNTSGSGGGLHLDFAQNSTVSHCAFVGNLAQSGSGADLGGNGAVVNCTFTANTVNGNFGGGAAVDIYNFSGQIINCVIWGNPYGGVNQSPPPGQVNYTDIQGGVSGTGTGNINADPRFLRAPSPGPDSTWGTFDDFYGDLRMRGDSLAIDAGSNAAVPAGVTTDLAGQPRFVDKPNVGSPSTTVDMGAYESQPRMVSPVAPHSAWGKTILSAVGSSFVPGPLQYAWDLDNDGQFDDAAGASIVMGLDDYTAPTTLAIAVRVTDPQMQTVIGTTWVDVVMTVVYVDLRATGNGDGTSWDNAVTDLESAISRGIHNQEFRVAGGTYKPSTIGDPTASFHLRSGVKVLGGYAGLGAADPDERDVAVTPTILSGDIGAPGASADNSLHVVQASYLWNFGTLDGLTITGGNANGRLSGPDGGGMLITSGKPTLRNITFTLNTASYGAALFNRLNATPTLIDCTFTGNVAVYDGGAILNNASSPTVINGVFVGNRAMYGGGAIYNTTSSFPAPTPSRPTIINSTFTANGTTLGGGGAIYDYDGFSTLANCILWGNTSPNGLQIQQLNGGTIVTYSDIQGGFAGTGNIDADPVFVRTPSSGGDGAWGTADDDYGDGRLQMISPCVDTGDTTAVPANVTTDHAGRARVFDFPGVHDPGAIVDMGAHELGTTLGVLRVADGETFALPTGGHTFLIEQLELGSGATLDVADNTLVLDYEGASTIGAFDGVAYDGVTGMIARAYNFSAWDGPGLSTSMPQAAEGLTTLAVGEAADVIGVSGEQTTLWHGVVVDATAVIVRYTYAGDMNLDGLVDAADYGAIDNWVQFPGTWGHGNGDLNFDGVIDAADYGVIDNSIQMQGPPL